MAFCFANYVIVGQDNDTFTDAMGAQTITAGIYRFDEFAEAFLATWTLANRRFTLTSTGHVRLDNNGGGNFTIDWDDQDLRDYLGFTSNLAGANSYLAARKVRGIYVADKATLAEHDPQPTGIVKQTQSIGGQSRTTWMGRRIDRTEFVLQFIHNGARLESPSSCYGTTYANAASTEQGLTEYRHCLDFWSDCTDAANQGWSDGRPVSYFENATDAVFTMTSASAPAWDASTAFSDWVFDAEGCSMFPRAKHRPPVAVNYALNLLASEYIAP